MDFLLHTQLHMYLLVVPFGPHSPYLLHNLFSRLSRYHITCRLLKAYARSSLRKGTKRIRMCLTQKKTLFPSILLILSYPSKPSLGAHQTKPRSLPLNQMFFFFFFFKFLLFGNFVKKK